MHHPRTHLGALAASLLLVVAAGPARGETPGRVHVFEGPSVGGQIVAVSPNGIEIETRGKTLKVPIENIREVTFTSEPQALKTARIGIAKGQPAQALEDLKAIESGEMEGADQLVVDDFAFAKAAAVGGKAAASGENLAAGEKALLEYLGDHPQSHHFFPMQELLARVLTMRGKYGEAADALVPLDKGPPSFKVRASAARARIFYDQKKYDDALQAYKSAAAIPTPPEDEASTVQKRAAQLGAARCLARQGKTDDAVELVERQIAESDPGDVEVLSRAYLVLGDAWRAVGKDQDAIVAYLTVELVHNGIPDNRAEALFNLVELWDKGKFVQRAEEARQQLAAYPDSIWARKLAGGKSP